MEAFFNDLIDWMVNLSPLWVYIILLVVAYVENVLPPIPGDLMIAFGGYLVGLGKLNFLLVVLLSTLGGTLGFMTMYGLGSYAGKALLDPNRFRWLPKEQILKVKEWLGRWGYGVIAANRFLSGARSVISLTVGMAHMHAGRTAILACLSAAIWSALIIFAGYSIGENWEIISVYLRRYGQIVLILLVLFFVVKGVRYYLRKK